MRNLIMNYSATFVILGIILSLTNAEYSGSKDGFGKKSGFDSSYSGYLGDNSAKLNSGKALGELHGYSESSEHGNQFEEGESHHFGESFGEQNDGGEDSSHFDRYSGGFEPLKFPQDIEAHHYTGGSSSDDDGIEDENKQHQFENHNYQFDEPAKNSDFKGYHSFEGSQIVPYSGNEEAEQHEESPPQYSGYEHSNENEVSKSSSKAPASSYSHSYEAFKAPSSSSYSNSYETSKPSALSHSHSYESSKIPSYSHSFDSSKTPSSSSYSSSYESQKTPSSIYEPIKTPSLSHEPSLGSYGIKYQHASSVQEAPSKLVKKIKSSGLKGFHLPLQKNIMTINHGKGGYSFSSLYRS